MRIHVSIARQELTLFDAAGRALRRFAVSTAANGPGEREGSGCTPRGRHRVRAKIGAGCPLYTVFLGRRPTGERWSPELEQAQPGRDWILTRILWLCGEERGINRGLDESGRCVDSQRRYIYIHGGSESSPLGVARSHGCIRMNNQDVLALFDLTPLGTEVWIEA